MKRQQLFHSFLPGFTVAVLTTQPAWANVVNMSEVQPGSYPNVLISTNSRNLFTQVTNHPGLLFSSYFRQGSIS
ncbi:TolC family protein, partial [Dolichospermum circinale CS-545/17]|nr:TolC family protein [Dolichospermum circinale CS-545/17]